MNADILCWLIRFRAEINGAFKRARLVKNREKFSRRANSSEFAGVLSIHQSAVEGYCVSVRHARDLVSN